MKLVLAIMITVFSFGALNAQDHLTLKAGAVNKLAGLTLPKGFAFQELTLPRGMAGEPGVTKVRIYTLESKNPKYKILISHTRFLEVNVTPKIFNAAEGSMLESLKSSTRSIFKPATNPLLRRGLKGNRTFLRQLTNAGEGDDHFDIYAFYAKDSIWFINFMSPSVERLSKLSKGFMSEVKVP